MLVHQSWTVYQDSDQVPRLNLASYTNCIPGLASRGLQCQTLEAYQSLGEALVDI